MYLIICLSEIENKLLDSIWFWMKHAKLLKCAFFMFLINQDLFISFLNTQVKTLYSCKDVLYFKYCSTPNIIPNIFGVYNDAWK